MRLALVLSVSASWQWLSSLFTVAGNCYAKMALGESIFKAFWSLMVISKGRRGS
jgi:hypothetical protein